MRIHGRAIAALILVAALVSTLTPSMPATAQSPSGFAAPTPPQPSGARLLSSTESGLSFSIEVPWEQLLLEPVTVEGVDYVQISLPGSSPSAEPGAPALPIVATSIGVPFGATVGVRVEPRGAHTIALTAPPLPAATRTLERQPAAPATGSEALPATTLSIAADPAYYAGASAYPASLAEISSDGIMRQQRVAGLAVYPVRYAPATQQLTIYESLTVIVSFVGARGASAERESGAPESAAYEELLARTLVNYASARGWRRSPESVVAAALAVPDAEAPTPWTPPSPGWRIKVRADGFYRLGYSELQTAGLPVGVGADRLNPHTLKLYAEGSEIAAAEIGDGDIYFEDGEYLQFYGQAVTSKYAVDNVYWLTYGGATGLRMLTRSGDPQGAEPPDSYQATKPMEVNRYYIAAAPGDETLDRWLWDFIFPPSKPRTSSSFTLAGPATAPATLTLTLLGNLDSATTNPDHHAVITLNNTQIGEAWWDGVSYQTLEMAVPAGLLAANNTFTVTCPNDTGLGTDVVYLDWARLDYASTFTAQNNTLSFGYDASGDHLFPVKGFTSNLVEVYDVTDAAHVERIGDVEITGSGPYTATFQDTLDAPAEYWAMATSTYRTVQAIERDTASSLQSLANGADTLIITHSTFAAQLEPLRAHRAGQGLRAVLVDVQDIYDEFSYGRVEVTAIHDFLAYTYASWVAPAPSFVVLVGDGTYDPKNYSYARTSFIHPYLAPVDPWLGETAADNRYVTLVGADTLPDMMLGRLAVNSTAEASAFVSKIIAYDSSTGDWQQQVLAVADNVDIAGNFAAITDDLLASYLPSPYQATKVYYGITSTDPAVIRAAIVSNINAGKLLVNYIGHAASIQWADEALFRVADVAGLTNAGKYPVIVAMTCREGYYHFPYPLTDNQDALAEVITRAAAKGAVASWSPTGLGVAAGHDYLNRGFYQALFFDGVDTIGEATGAGKLALWATGTHRDLLDTYLLFGDPATPSLVPTPTVADLAVTKSVSPTELVYPGDVLTYTLTFANNGPDTATGIVLSDLLPDALVNPQIVSATGGAALRNGTTFIWDIASLAPSAGGTIVIRATIDPNFSFPTAVPAPVAILSAAAPDSVILTNSATISGSVPDSVPTNNSATASILVAEPVISADLQVNKAVSPSAPVVPGATLTYTLTFTNNGPYTAAGVVLDDPLSYLLVDPTVVSATGDGDPMLRDGTLFTWDIASLEPGASGTIIVRGTVDPETPFSTTIENTVSIYSSAVDPVPANNSAAVFSDVEIPVPTADLELVKTVEPTGSVNPGAVLTYTLGFANIGPDAATDVVISDPLPTGLINPQVVSAGGGAVLRSGTTYTWDVASLASGASGTIVLRATVNPALAAPATIENTATITALELDPVTVNNTASIATNVVVAGQSADLTVAKAISTPGPVLPGATLTYTITYSNLGPDAASAVVLNDLLPAGLIDAQVVSSSGGAVLQPGTSFTWSIASLASGSGGTIVFRATVDPSLAAPTSLTNTASITGAEPDPLGSNNAASVSTPIYTALYLPAVYLNTP